MAEVVVMMTIVVHVSNVVEVETVTNTVEMLSNQVGIIMLEDKPEAVTVHYYVVHYYVLRVIPVSVKTSEHQEVVTGGS